jgi:energy-coupling factor transporter ATP-binding protein EcfA2
VLVKKPQLLILDDVLAELDPHSSSLVRTALEQERRQGLTIVELHSRPPVTGVPPDAMWVFVTASGIIQGKLCDCWPTVKSVAPDLLPPFPLLAARLESDLGLNYEVAPEGAPEVAAPLDLKTGCHEQTISNQATNEESVALAVRSLEFEYAGGSRFHLGPMDCFFPRASATALLGRNGSGKTTLMACLGHLLKPMKGEISFSRGGPVARDPLHVWARTIVYSFQNPDDQIFLPTVRDEVLALAMMTGRAGRDADVRLEKVCKILELMPHLSDPPMDLPFPLRRLITVAGVFVAAPDIVLLDEPSAGLDRHQIVSIIRIVRDYCCFGGTVVFVSHDPEFVAETATHALVLEDGQVTLQGTFDELAPTLPLPMQSAAYVLAKELGLQRSICRYRDLLRSLYAKGSPSFQSGMG